LSTVEKSEIIPENLESKISREWEKYKLETSVFVKANNTLGNLLVACHIMGDGRGDLENFIKFVQFGLDKVEFTKRYQKVYLLSCSESYAEEVERRVKAIGIESYSLIIYKSDFEPETGLLILNEYQTNEHFRQELDEVELVFNISTPFMEEFLTPILVRKAPKVAVPIFNIPELGAPNARKLIESENLILHHEHRHKNNIRIRNTGAGFNEHGFYLGGSNVPKLSTRERTDSYRAKRLATIEDREFLGKMLDIDPKLITEEHCLQFIKQSHLFPAYFQEGPYSSAVFILGLALSELHRNHKFKEFVCCVNPNNFSRLAFSSDICKEYKIQIWYIKDNEKPIKYGTPTKENPQLFIKIYEHWFKNSDDRNCLYDASSFGMGCSGDTDFETALEKGSIPFLQVRRHKLLFLMDFITLLQDAGFLQLVKFFKCLNLLYGTNIEREDILADRQKNVLNYAKELSGYLNSEFLNEWNLAIKLLYADYNFSVILPQIIEQCIYSSLLERLTKQSPKDNRLPGLQDQISNLENHINRRSQHQFKKILEDIREKRVGKCLNLSNKNFLPHQWEAIFEALAKNPDIEELNLSHNYDSANTLVPLLSTFMKNDNRIKKLNLEHCSIDDALLEHLCTGLRNHKTVEKLNLNQNSVGSTNRGMDALAKVLVQKNCAVKKLYLFCNTITDASLKGLIHIIKENTSLTVFHSCDANISEHGKHLLADMFLQYNKTIRSRFFVSVKDAEKRERIQKKLFENGEASENSLQNALSNVFNSPNPQVEFTRILHERLKNHTPAEKAKSIPLISSFCKMCGFDEKKMIAEMLGSNTPSPVSSTSKPASSNGSQSPGDSKGNAENSTLVQNRTESTDPLVFSRNSRFSDVFASFQSASKIQFPNAKS